MRSLIRKLRITLTNSRKKSKIFKLLQIEDRRTQVVQYYVVLLSCTKAVVRYYKEVPRLAHSQAATLHLHPGVLQLTPSAHVFAYMTICKCRFSTDPCTSVTAKLDVNLRIPVCLNYTHDESIHNNPKGYLEVRNAG